MVKKQLLYRAAAATVLGLSLTGGVAAAHGNNGHYSDYGSKSLTTTHQNNNVSATNNTDQSADTGKAVVVGNYRGGSATTGDATNHSSSQVQVGVGNTTPSAPVAGPDNSGSSDRHSDSSSSMVTSVNQNNNVDVENNTDQSATSGDAVVVHNGKGGSATTGDATNHSSSTVTVTVGNN